MNTNKARFLCAMALLLILAATAVAQVSDLVKEQKQKEDVVIRTFHKRIQPRVVDNPQTATGADVTIGSGVTVTLGTGVTMSLGGNFTNSGTVTAQTGSTVDFNGTGDQTLTGATTFSAFGRSTGGILTINSPVTINDEFFLDGGQINLNSPATVNNYLFLDGGQLNNSTNPVILANGVRLYRTRGTITNPPTINGSVKLVYDGDSAVTTGPELPTSSTGIHSLVVDGAGIILGASATPTVNDTLKLYKGKITLGSRNLTLASGALIKFNPPDTSYVETNGTGVFTYRSVGSTPKLFPVGAGGSYNPVTVTNSGTPDTFSVRVKTTFDSPPAQPTKVVNRQWTVTEAIAGGSNATLQFQWNAVDQASGFSTGSPIVIGRHDGMKWVEQSAAFGGPNPYTAAASGFTSFSPFAVGNTNAVRTVVLANLKVLLDGPYNSTTQLMDKTLNTSGLLATKFPGKPIPANAVDSIQIEIRGTPTGVLNPVSTRATRVEVADAQQERNYQSEDAVRLSVSEKPRMNTTVMKLAGFQPSDLADGEPTSPLVVTSKTSQPMWLLTDGTIRNFTDTTKSYVEFDTSAASYFVVVRHRNHLAIMSSGPQALSSSPPAAYDFTSDSLKAYGTPNAPMKLVGTNKYAMWAGDVTGNGELKYTGSLNDRLPIFQRIGGVDPNATVSGYYNEDVLMDGIVKYTGSGNDRLRIFQNIGGVNPNATRSTQVPQ